MKNKHLFNLFNKQDSLFIVSEFSPSEKGSTGLARFATNTAEHMDKSRIIILTDIKNNNSKIYQKDDILVIPCFKKNNPLSFFQIFLTVLRFDKVKNILFEFEFASYGNLPTVATIPFVIFLMKITRKKVFFALHQVAENLNQLHSHLGLDKNSPLIKLLNAGLWLFYKTLGIITNKVIVLEEELRNKLSIFINKNKIAFIPHGVENIVTTSENTYRQELNYGKNDLIILVFGYIAWYKGIDRLIDSFNKLPKTINNRKVKLIIAGGYSHAQAGKAHYERHYQTVIEKAKKNKNILITGFVPEEKIVNYFSISDLCLVPYRKFISSSGPLSLALAFNKPVILSYELKDYLESKDFRKAFNSSRLNIENLFVKINTLDLKKILIKFTENNKYYNQLTKFAINLKQARNWSKITRSYRKIMNTKIKKADAHKYVLNTKHRKLIVGYN